MNTTLYAVARARAY